MNLYVILQFNFRLILLKPHINLTKICHKLRTSHKLTKPRSSKSTTISIQNLPNISFIQNIFNWSIWIIHNRNQLFLDSTQISRIMSFRIRTLFPITISLGKSSLTTYLRSPFSLPFKAFISQGTFHIY